MNETTTSKTKSEEEEEEVHQPPPPTSSSSRIETKRGVDHDYHDYANIRGEDAAFLFPPSNNNNTNNSASSRYVVATAAAMRQPNPMAACGIQQQGFAVKLHYMLAEIETSEKTNIVSWQPHGRCFVVHDRKAFVEHILPSYFLQSTFASFQRQLNLYGFKRISSSQDKGGYYHELFLRGKPELACYIQRIKRKGSGPRKPDSPDSEPNFYAMDYLPSSQQARNLFVGSCYQDPMMNATNSGGGSGGPGSGAVINNTEVKPPAAIQVLTLKGMLPVAMLQSGGGDSASYVFYPSAPPPPPSNNNRHQHHGGGGHYGSGGGNVALPPPGVVAVGVPIIPRPQPMYPSAPPPPPPPATAVPGATDTMHHAVAVQAVVVESPSNDRPLQVAPRAPPAARPGGYNYFHDQWDSIAPRRSKAPAGTTIAATRRPAPPERVSETIVHYQTQGTDGVVHSTTPAESSSSGLDLLSGTIVHYQYQTSSDYVGGPGPTNSHTEGGAGSVPVPPLPHAPPSRPRSSSHVVVQPSCIAATAEAGGSIRSYTPDGRRSSRSRSSVVTIASSECSNGCNNPASSSVRRTSFDERRTDPTVRSHENHWDSGAMRGPSSRNVVKAQVGSYYGERTGSSVPPTGPNNCNERTAGDAKPSGEFIAPRPTSGAYNQDGAVASSHSASHASTYVDLVGIPSDHTRHHVPVSQDQSYGWTSTGRSAGDHGCPTRGGIPPTGPSSGSPRVAQPGAFSAYNQSSTVAGSMIPHTENRYAGGRPMPLQPSVFTPEASSNKMNGNAHCTLVSVQHQDAANHNIIPTRETFIPLEHCALQPHEDSNPPPHMPTLSRNSSQSLSPTSWNNTFGEEEDFWSKMA